MVSVAFLMLGNSIFTTLLALRAKIEGYPNTLVGLMMSGYFLGFALGTFRSGPLINRVGHIRAFSALAPDQQRLGLGRPAGCHGSSDGWTFHRSGELAEQPRY